MRCHFSNCLPFLVGATVPQTNFETLIIDIGRNRWTSRVNYRIVVARLWNELNSFIPIPLYHAYSCEALTPDPRNLFIPRCCCPGVPTMPLYDVLYALDCVGHKALHSGGQRLVIDEWGWWVRCPMLNWWVRCPMPAPRACTMPRGAGVPKRDIGFQDRHGGTLHKQANRLAAF